MSESFLELMPKDWEPVNTEACKAEFDDVKQNYTPCNCDGLSYGTKCKLHPKGILEEVKLD